MATFVLTDASVVINAVDLSDHVDEVAVDYGAIPQDDTVMGDDTEQFIGGNKKWTMRIKFKQDYAASKVDVTLFSIVGTVVTVTVKPTTAAVSATNPSLSGSGLIADYSPIGNTVGDEAAATLSILAGGTLTRATS